jgi:hypothetical protein
MIEFRSVRGVELVHAAVAALVFGSALGRSCLLPVMLDEANVTMAEFEEQQVAAGMSFDRISQQEMRELVEKARAAQQAPPCAEPAKRQRQ